MIGLRADEMLRVFKQYEKNAEGKMPWKTAVPMVDFDMRRKKAAIRVSRFEKVERRFRGAGQRRQQGKGRQWR